VGPISRQLSLVKTLGRLVMKFALLSILLGLSTHTFAEDTSSALAKRLFIALDYQSSLNAVAEQMTEMMTNQIVPADIPEEASSFVEMKFREMYSIIIDVANSEDIQNQYIKSIEETFSINELKSAVTFFESPEGKAFTAKSPQIQEDLMTFIAPQMAALHEEMSPLLDEIYSEIRKYK